jgi:hypothetical protein
MADYIRTRTWPTDHAKAAYESGHFIEALQVLHGWMESRLQQILLLQRAKLQSQDDGTFGRAWDVSFELSLNNIAKALFVAGLISEDLLNKLVRFKTGFEMRLFTKCFLNLITKSIRGCHAKNTMKRLNPA